MISRQVKIAKAIVFLLHKMAKQFFVAKFNKLSCEKQNPGRHVLSSLFNMSARDILL